MQTSNNLPEILTVKEVQQILKIGTYAAYNLIHSKSFPVIKIGSVYRIPAKAFFTWLDGTHGADKAVHQ